MSMIYPDEAWRRFGPPPLLITDAKGRQLFGVVACDPLTGEVIEWIPKPMTCSRLFLQFRAWPILRLIIFTHWDIGACGDGFCTRHYFAPAPITFTRVFAGEQQP